MKIVDGTMTLEEAEIARIWVVLENDIRKAQLEMDNDNVSFGAREINIPNDIRMLGMPVVMK